MGMFVYLCEVSGLYGNHLVSGFKYQIWVWIFVWKKKPSVASFRWMFRCNEEIEMKMEFVNLQTDLFIF